MHDLPRSKGMVVKRPAGWFNPPNAKSPVPKKDTIDELMERRAAAAAEAALDQAEYASLLGLLEILRDPSIAGYTGLSFPFNGPGVPEPRKGCTASGVIIDASKDTQKLITRWGVLPFKYALTFEGYQDEKKETANSASDTAKPYHVRHERSSLFFSLCDSAAPILLSLAKLTGARFRVTTVLGASYDAESGKPLSPSSDEATALRERWWRLAESPVQPKVARALQASKPI